jgi:hypothetical protein
MAAAALPPRMLMVIELASATLASVLGARLASASRAGRRRKVATAPIAG